MGRHGAAPRTPAARIVAIVLGVAILGGGATLAFNMLSGSEAAEHGSAASASSAAGRTPSAPAPATEEPAGTGAAAAALRGCVEEVRAGERLADAAAKSAKAWGAHAGAQIDLDAGKIDFAQAEVVWARTKAGSEQDVARFAAAKQAYTAAAGPCAGVVEATHGTPLAEQATACADRAEALAGVAARGAEVDAQWAAHIAQMKTKATAAGPAYHARWMEFVSDSRPVLAHYETAAEALSKAPACS